MKRRLLVLCFVEGGAVMAAELCGAKLLAPVFGGTLFVWASVLGVTLTALALGYLYGAFIASGEADRKRLGTLLIAASLSVVLMPAIARLFIPFIVLLPFFPAILLSSVMLIFPAIFLLGAASPLFISMQSQHWPAGKASGMVYAISTTGGIVATFLCGFFLIPVAGLQVTLVIYGAVLFLLTILFLKIPARNGAIILAGGVLASVYSGYARANVVFKTDGVLGRIEVTDEFANNDTLRRLKVNGIVQTEQWLRNRTSPSDYLRLIDSVLPSVKNRRSALVLGLGGGAAATMLSEKNYRCDAVEFDQRIIRCARDYFRMDTVIRVLHADARYFLNHSTKRYDLILFDVFKAEEGPAYVLTLESVEQLKKNLTANGMVIINWHGFVEGDAGAGTRVIISTLKAAGYNTMALATQNDEAHRNLLLFARVAGKMPASQSEIEIEESDVINTDDTPALELYNARAAKRWRSSYLQYYSARGEVIQ